MNRLPTEVETVLTPFASLFSCRVWPRAQVLLIGAILAPGKRTVSQILRVMGLCQEPHFQNYHRVLNRAIWSPLAASRTLLLLLIQAFAPTGPLLFGLDDTLERRRGDKIRAKGIYRDPVRSSNSHFVKASGLRWLSLMLLTPISFAERIWALPFMNVLCPSERYYQGRGRSHQPLTQRAQKMLRLLVRWLPERPLVIVADSSFAAIELLAAIPKQMTMVTRLRLDAALYEPAPPRKQGQNGRPRLKGKRLPTLQQVAIDPDTTWQPIQLARWYSQLNRDIEIVSGTAVWYHSGMPVVPIRWVLVRDPLDSFDPQAFLSTNLDVSPEQILTWFTKRWQVETTFQALRDHLGMETQRHWADPAITRVTPVIIALFSIVTLIAKRLIETHSQPIAQTAWYQKTRPTFADALAWVRKTLWQYRLFSMSAQTRNIEKVPTAFLNALTDTLAYAA